MYYRPSGDYTWHWGRGLPEKTFEKWIDANRAFSVHFLSIKFCILPIDIFSKLWLFFSFKAPISGIRVAGEFFTIAVGDHIKGSFYPLVVVGGGVGVSPRFFFYEKRMQMVHSEPFLGRLLVNIFSKIVADFCHDFEFTLYIEVIFSSPVEGGGVSFSFY